MQANTLLTPRVLVILGFISAAVLMRLLPHLPNMTPIAAMALFGGAYFINRRLAFLIPLAAMVISDVALGYGIHATTPFVYASFALIVCLGLLIQQRRSPLTIAATALTGSVLFFIITNFGVWLQGGLYPMTFDGLLTCYTMAIPFFSHTLAGDMMYTLVLFGGFALVQHYFPGLREHRATRLVHG